MSTVPAFSLTLVTGASEQLVTSTNARLIKILPQGTAAGTATVREASAIGSGATPRWTNAANVTADFGTDGVAFAGGITVQLSNGADTYGIIWGPRL